MPLNLSRTPQPLLTESSETEQSNLQFNADRTPVPLDVPQYCWHPHSSLSFSPHRLCCCLQSSLWELCRFKARGQEDSLRSVILNMTTPQNTNSHDWYPIWFNSMFEFWQKLIQFNVWFTIVYPKFNPKYCSNQILPSKPVDWTKKVSKCD